MEKPELDMLISLCLKDDKRAFRSIVEQFQSMVYSLAYRILQNREEAEDIVQETFIRVWVHLEKFDREKNFKTWLYKIASNLCLDKLKLSSRSYRHESFGESFDYLVSPEDADRELMEGEMAGILAVLTGHLTPKQKIVFTLRCLDQLEISEIVEITGLSPSKIKSNLFLARRSMRDKLENYGK